ncbi:MAG: hypothetical protein IJ965_00815, partial [Campylobacter sp.]|nr:hypothetical protein [Campylobacter sp.]
LKLRNPYLMTIIALPLAYVFRVAKIAFYIFVLISLFKIIDWFFDAKIMSNIAIYISKFDNLEIYIYFVLAYIFIKTIFALIRSAQISNYNKLALLIYDKGVNNDFKKEYFEMVTLKVQDIDLADQESQEHNVVCPDCGYVYYDENNPYLKERNRSYENFIQSKIENSNHTQGADNQENEK